jgi:hypothetical protein
MTLVACRSCRALIYAREKACPFCNARVHSRASNAAAKIAVGAIAGATAFISGIGCAYGCPDCYPLDSGNPNKPDVSVFVDSGMDASDASTSDASTSDAAKDAATDVEAGAPTDAESDSPTDAPADG